MHDGLSQMKIRLAPVLLTLCMLGIFHFVCRLLNFFKLKFSKISFMNTVSVSNSLDPDQDQCSVCLDLGLNCLQRFISRQ